MRLSLYFIAMWSFALALVLVGLLLVIEDAFSYSKSYQIENLL